MSHLKKLQLTGFDSLTMNDSDNNKPDFKALYLSSQVSPLITRGSNTNGVATATATSSSSSSSSSGSASGKINATQLATHSKNSNHSGELSGFPGSGPTQRSLKKPGHRRSVSAGPRLIYSGSSFSTASNARSCYNCNGAHSVSSNPNTSNVLPSGNICPSGKILKTGMTCRVSNRTDTLGTGTGNYGHGSIVPGNSNSNSNNNNNSNNAKLSNVAADAEEAKRAGNEMYRKGNFVEALKLYDKAISMSPEKAAYWSNRAAALTALGRLTEAVSECEEAVRLDSGYSRAHQRLASLYFR